MKKSPIRSNKLNLDRETVRALSPEELRRAVGGLMDERTITCSPGTDCCSYKCTSYTIA